MSAELQAHGNLIGGVRSATRAHKLSLPKKKAKKGGQQQAGAKNERTQAKGSKQEPASNKPVGGSAKEEPMKVSSTRVNAESRAEGNRALPRPSYKPSGPTPITAPGPTARETAAEKSKVAQRGTKNKESIKVAQPMVDLTSPDYPVVHEITDLPRQWNRQNG